MQTRTTAFRDLDAQTSSRVFFARWKQSLKLSNSVVRHINHALRKYGYGVSKSKLARIATVNRKSCSHGAASLCGLQTLNASTQRGG
jgi:hypothetical protein